MAIIFTPDDTHFAIAMACIERGMYVMVTKPIVQNLSHHRQLAEAAREHNVLVAVEVHKRLDPFYADARDRALSAALGGFQYLYAYVSQPKHQLFDTFVAWAGQSYISASRQPPRRVWPRRGTSLRLAASPGVCSIYVLVGRTQE